MVSPRSLLIAAPALVVIVVGFILLRPGGGHGDVTGRATAICEVPRREFASPAHPTSVAQALQLEHEFLAAFRAETADLRALAPQGGVSFRAGVKDLQDLGREMSKLVDRPDYVHLAVTLPDHPGRAPAWLKRWQARTQALAADAESRFDQAGVPACGGVGKPGDI